MKIEFKKAKREKAKLRLGLTGPSGSGKTWGALLIAKGLGGRIAVLDTEHGSARLYEHLADFDVMEMPPPYRPENFIEVIDAAEKAGYDTLIIDSITHEWSGAGGCLELNDELTRSTYKGNSYQAWGETGARHRRFIDKILQSKLHVIATMRSKTETALQESITGKKQVVKLGMKSEQREGSEYELTTVLDIVHEGHYATASKDRTGLFTDKDPAPITEQTGVMLLNWLNSGAEPEQKKAAEAMPDFDGMIANAVNRVELNAIFQIIPKHLQDSYKTKLNERLNEIKQPKAIEA